MPRPVRYLDHRTQEPPSVDLRLIYTLCRLNDIDHRRTASPPGGSTKRRYMIVVAMVVVAGFGVQQLKMRRCHDPEVWRVFCQIRSLLVGPF
jgi:hypothetical protein